MQKQNLISLLNIEPSKKIQILIKDSNHQKLIHQQIQEILLLTRGEKLEIVSELPSGVPLARGILKDSEVAINLAAVLNVQTEKERLLRELKKIETELAQAQKKLANENFLKNAPPDVVAEQKAKYEDLNGRKVRTEETLHSLGS
jgi:valyl-tRNA synthetase